MAAVEQLGLRKHLANKISKNAADDFALNNWYFVSFFIKCTNPNFNFISYLNVANCIDTTFNKFTNQLLPLEQILPISLTE
jgi:hypothetical protein